MEIYSAYGHHDYAREFKELRAWKQAKKELGEWASYDDKEERRQEILREWENQ